MKVLIIRFSSIGDLTQSLSIPHHIKKIHPGAEIHFLTRSDFKDLFLNNRSINKLWTIDRDMSAIELIHYYIKLNQEEFTHIYDAHNNMRSLLARLFISADHKLVRSMDRIKRFLLIYFKLNLFEKPLSGQRDLLNPLNQWDIPFQFPQSLPTENLFVFSEEELKIYMAKFKLPENFFVIVPSAAYELKRWPIKNWNNYISSCPQTTFIVLAGKNDQFTQALNHNANVINLTGETSLRESTFIISQSQGIIANDTGLMHISEQLGKPTIALMGPAPFGFPSRKTTKILERDLPCRPCSKHGQGPCVNANYHECLASIGPEEVKTEMNRLLGSL